MKSKLKTELIVRIHYDIEGEFSDETIPATIRERALDSGLGGSVGFVADRIEMILEGTPIDIGGFVSDIHRHIPRNSRIKRLVPLSKTVIESMNGKFTILEPDLSVETTPIVDLGEGASHDDIRSALLAGKIHRIVVHSMEYHAVDAFNEEACAKLAEINEAEIALLFSNMDEIFEHCAFNADAVKRLVANPKETVKLKLRETTTLASIAGVEANCEISVKLADPHATTIFDSNSTAEQGSLAVLAIIRVE